MRLSRIRIEQLRQFGAPFELRDLEHGLNLFTGPNEAGKSTVVRAIRAAFFERYRTGDVKDLVPHNDPAAAPTVELDFVIGAQAYALRKVWLKRHRCELSMGTRRLDGDEAEQHLAQLLGFGIAGKKASQAKHQGIPGLLWIEQGTGHEMREAVEHAADHLRSALKASAAEVASTQGDAVIARVAALRAELLTEAKGAPRGEFAGVIEECERLAAALAGFEQATASHRQQVDTLTQLAAEHAVEQTAPPWQALRAQQAEVRERLQMLKQRMTELASDQKDSSLVQQQLGLLQDKLDGIDARQQALHTRQRAIAAAAAQAAQADAACKVWAQQQQAAEHTLEQAQRALAAAETEELRRRLEQQGRDAQAQLESLVQRLAAAEQEAALLRTALDVQAQAQLTLPVLESMRERDGRLRELQIRREAAQTRIEFRLRAEAGGRVALDGELLHGTGERLLGAAATLEIAGIGSVTVVPGRSDAAQLAREEAELQAAQAAEFQRHGVATLADAQARQLRHAQAQADSAQAKKALGQLAPKGLDALRDERGAQQRRHDEAAQQLQRLPPCAAETVASPLSLPEARTRCAAAQNALNQAVAQAQQAQHALSHASATASVARDEHRALHDETSAPAFAQRRDETVRALQQLRTEQQRLAERIAQRQRELDGGGESADTLTRHAERLEKSAAHAQAQFLEREQRIAHLRGQLEAVGAQGLEERQAECAAQLAQVQRREHELRARAEALSLLLELLTEQRRQATQRLQAPLQKHVARYLQLLHPGAQLEIDEQLLPTVLTRVQRGAASAQVSPLDALSFGAREQMGVLGRLAYADLLKEAGHPTLVILDDALVHSDAERLARMKHALYDAAERHQILLFTCHPDAWRDAGARPQRIGVVA